MRDRSAQVLAIKALSLPPSLSLSLSRTHAPARRQVLAIKAAEIDFLKRELRASRCVCVCVCVCARARVVCCVLCECIFPPPPISLSDF